MELFSEYFKKDHFLLRIDARVKLLVALAILVMVLSYKGFVFSLFVSLLGAFLCVKMRIPLRIFLLRFSEPLFIVSVIILLKFLLSGRDGLIEGAMIAVRIFAAVTVVAILGFSTPFTEFMSALSWMRIPRGFIEILMFAYRYIFVLFEDAMVIYNAQKNRLGYSNIRRGLGSFGALTGSLMLKAFEHSHNITVSMIQRGYDGTMPAMRHKPFRFSEVAASVLLVFAMGFIWKI